MPAGKIPSISTLKHFLSFFFFFLAFFLHGTFTTHIVQIKYWSQLYIKHMSLVVDTKSSPEMYRCNIKYINVA